MRKALFCVAAILGVLVVINVVDYISLQLHDRKHQIGHFRPKGK